MEIAEDSPIDRVRELLAEGKSQREVGRILGISHDAVFRLVSKIRREPSELQNPIAKRTSTLYHADGTVKLKWVREEEAGNTPEALVDLFKSAFAGFEGYAQPIPSPVITNDLLTLIPANDWHINMLAWERETGSNWDLKIAERVLGDTISAVIQRSPSSAVAVVLGGGDLMHMDTNDNRTRSGNVLQGDGRHQKGMEVAQRLKVRTIDLALQNNLLVIVRILKGNHDEYSAVAIAYFLLAWYRNEPRVRVDVDPSLFWWFQWGLNFLAATHGHTCPIHKMPTVMAARRPEIWGATKFRYAHGFHVHHMNKKPSEEGAVICETHQAPIPPDDWHFGCGYVSGRSMQTITYDKQYGERSRVREIIIDA